MGDGCCVLRRQQQKRLLATRARAHSHRGAFGLQWIGPFGSCIIVPSKINEALRSRSTDIPAATSSATTPGAASFSRACLFGFPFALSQARDSNPATMAGSPPLSPDAGPTDPHIPKLPSGWIAQWDSSSVARPFAPTPLCLARFARPRSRAASLPADHPIYPVRASTTTSRSAPACRNGICRRAKPPRGRRSGTSRRCWGPSREVKPCRRTSRPTRHTHLTGRPMSTAATGALV